MQRPEPSGEQPLESTSALLQRARGGDDSARNRLFERYLPSFQRWAHGRLPRHMRGVTETNDLVQVTLMRAFQHIESFEPRREGSFLAYLRQILMNLVRDEIRRANVRPQSVELGDSLRQPGPSPLEDAVTAERIETYEAALEKLPERTREAVVLRLELGFTYAQVAEAISSPSANAARMLISRALLQMAEGTDGTQ
jgi:RNA polymerase sigma-70 factor (ECF subfamily)